MPRGDLEKVKAAEAADIKAARRVAKQEARAERRVARRGARAARWTRVVAFWKERAAELKIAGMVAGGAAVVVSSSVALYKNASSGWHAVKRAWSFYADRGVSAPAQPPPTGAPSTALDFPVTRGRPPDGGR